MQLSLDKGLEDEHSVGHDDVCLPRCERGKKQTDDILKMNVAWGEGQDLPCLLLINVKSALRHCCVDPGTTRAICPIARIAPATSASSTSSA